MSSFKRPRIPSHTSSASSQSSTEAPTAKASRTTPAPSGPDDDSPPQGAGVRRPLLCTLPPTCNHHPTPIADTRHLESHYATYHAHVCEQGSCGCVFPDARLLELHQTECHDPLAAVRKDRGDKIFACHLPTCTRLFLTPKARRLHLIQAHAYPKEYFFGVTNKGVGGLLKRWGEGASMIRGEWKPRAEGEGEDEPKQGSQNDDSDEDKVEEEEADIEVDHDVKGEDYTNNADTDHRIQQERHKGDTSDDALDGLTNSMNSLALVPPSIRFGRGGKNGGFVHTPRGGYFRQDAGRGGGVFRGKKGLPRGSPRGGATIVDSRVMDVDVNPITPLPQGHGPPGGRGGLGWAGRGRAGFNVRGMAPGLMYTGVGRGRDRGGATAAREATVNGVGVPARARGRGIVS